jgi:hypothetical protein
MTLDGNAHAIRVVKLLSYRVCLPLLGPGFETLRCGALCCALSDEEKRMVRLVGRTSACQGKPSGFKS